MFFPDSRNNREKGSWPLSHPGSFGCQKVQCRVTHVESDQPPAAESSGMCPNFRCINCIPNTEIRVSGTWVHGAQIFKHFAWSSLCCYLRLSKWLIATLGPHKKGPALALDFKGSGSAGHGRLGSLGKNLWDRTQCRRICRENSCVHHPCKWGNGSKAGQRGCQIVIQVPWELGWPQGTLRSLNQCFPPWEQKGRSTYSHLNSSLGVAPQKRTWPGASCLSVGETSSWKGLEQPHLRDWLRVFLSWTIWVVRPHFHHNLIVLCLCPLPLAEYLWGQG